MSEPVKLELVRGRGQRWRARCPGRRARCPRTGSRASRGHVALLGSGEWGEVTLKKDRILVTDVTPGSEEKLKHHLEAVIAQANATIEEDEGCEGEDQLGDPDAEMTERFRSLG